MTIDGTSLLHLAMTLATKAPRKIALSIAISIDNNDPKVYSLYSGPSPPGVKYIILNLYDDKIKDSNNRNAKAKP